MSLRLSTRRTADMGNGQSSTTTTQPDTRLNSEDDSSEGSDVPVRTRKRRFSRMNGEDEDTDYQPPAKHTTTAPEELRASKRIKLNMPKRQDDPPSQATPADSVHEGACDTQDEDFDSKFARKFQELQDIAKNELQLQTYRAKAAADLDSSKQQTRIKELEDQLKQAQTAKSLEAENNENKLKDLEDRLKRSQNTTSQAENSCRQAEEVAKQFKKQNLIVRQKTQRVITANLSHMTTTTHGAAGKEVDELRKLLE